MGWFVLLLHLSAIRAAKYFQFLSDMWRITVMLRRKKEKKEERKTERKKDSFCSAKKTFKLKK